MIILLIITSIWFVATMIWVFSPKETCVTELNGTNETKCFNSTREAIRYLKERDEEINKEHYEENNPAWDLNVSYPISASGSSSDSSS